ncbi:MAG: hypothetical protein EKK37_16290 [Sphingobacteriales bacterium]|nr:MAG: hypothetical protein EKK37_16290 [Sphingobacteriales bacterium]
MHTDPNKKSSNKNELDPLPGNPEYPSDEDIFNKAIKEPLKEETDSKKAKLLDVPGAELDDADELIGEEDEENNYYSLGGDDHNDLDENQE